MPSRMSRILWGAVGMLLVLLIIFIGFTLYLTWQHDYMIWRIMIKIAQLQQRLMVP